MVSSTLALLVVYSANYYFDDPWMNKTIGSGSAWLIFFTSRLCDAFAMFLFAGYVFVWFCLEMELITIARGRCLRENGLASTNVRILFVHSTLPLQVHLLPGGLPL